ncbi:MAG: exo-beta-N-acetylmuramidase NamZ domain-containing protein [Halarsenatibacteraceae bacterium]
MSNSSSQYRSGLDRVTGKEVQIPFTGPTGLITNHTGRDHQMRQNLDLLLNDLKLNFQLDIQKIFAPEHGFRGSGAAGEKITDSKDPASGLPVISLYGDNKKPSEDVLEGLETLVFDIQDVGVRYYTYISTLFYCLEAAKEHNLNFVILDRYNPLGRKIEGNLLDQNFKSFVGATSLPLRHGMTAGELAVWAVETGQIDGPKPGEGLEVIELKNWQGETCQEISQPWLPPSPNLPSTEATMLYPVTAIFEGTNLSEGRGTTLPFQIVGAPWLNNMILTLKMRSYEFPGVGYRPLSFTPKSSKHQGKNCKGIQLFITDPDKVDSLKLGLTLMAEIIKLHPEEFEFFKLDDNRYFIDLLLGTDSYREILNKLMVNQEFDFQQALDDFKDDYEEELEIFKRERDKYLIY